MSVDASFSDITDEFFEQFLVNVRHVQNILSPSMQFLEEAPTRKPNTNNHIVDRTTPRHHIAYHEYYIYIFVPSLVHAVTHYDVLATIGAVPIDVLNALRTVNVFASSSQLFCWHQVSQCLTSRKGIFTAMFICGGLRYSAASSASSLKLPEMTKNNTMKKKSSTLSRG